MTKAKTKGEAKRAKRGRPAHDGDREPNGRLQRDPKPNSVRMTMIAPSTIASWSVATAAAG